MAGLTGETTRKGSEPMSSFIPFILVSEERLRHMGFRLTGLWEAAFIKRFLEPSKEKAEYGAAARGLGASRPPAPAALPVRPHSWASGVAAGTSQGLALGLAVSVASLTFPRTFHIQVAWAGSDPV